MSFGLYDHEIIIGRSTDNDIQIRDTSISRHHIKIHLKEEKYFVEDLKSKNGTIVMGRPVRSGQKIELEKGHYIAIGNTVISLEEEILENERESLNFDSATVEVNMDKLRDLYKDRPLTYAKNMELIYNALEAIMGSLDLSELFEKFISYLFDILKRIDRGAILLMDQKTGELKEIISRSRYDKGKTDLNYSRTIVNRVIREGKPTIIEDLRQENLHDTSDTVKLIRSVMCVPLTSKSGIQGVIYVDTLGKPHGFRKEDLSLLIALSNSGAIAIDNARLYTNMEKMVETRTASLRKTEKRLRESEYRLKAIFNNMSSGVMVCKAANRGQDFVILDLNRATRKIENIKKKEVLDQSFTKILPFVKDSVLLETYKRVWQKGKPERCSMTLSRNGEISGWREYYLYRLPSGEVVAIYDDVTPKKRAEEKQKDLQKQLFISQKMESIGMIASGVAHNFRNILQAISGNMDYIELVYRDHAEIKELARSITEAVEKGSDLTTNLMHFSQKTIGVEFVNLDLSDVVMKTYEITSRIFDKKIDIKLNLESNLYIKGDQSLLSQVFMNLFTNARDAMPGGGILGIETRKEKGTAVAIVRDTGPGMDKAILEKIFDPFFTLKEVGKGTGLGLSTSHGIIKNHKGSISVTSRPGKGTSFKIRLPLVEAVRIQETVPAREIVFGKGEKILIVDDEEPVLDSLTKLIEKLGYQAISVQRSAEALHNYHKWQPDLVLMDRNMPEMDGIACIREIIKTDPKARIVIISGYDESGPDGIDEDIKKIIKGYLPKPCDSEELTQILSQALKKKKTAPKVGTTKK